MTTDRSVRRLPPLWLPVFFSALACGLAVSGSLMRPVWHDELYTLALARMPLSELFAALRIDSGPPLHYLICHGLYSIFGWTEGSVMGTFMVRLPSVLAYSLMPWVLWRWARWHGERYFWAALLTIAWLPMLYFATEARTYALLALVNAVLWLLGPDLVRSGGRCLVFFAALAAALPMLHYAGIVSFCFLPALALFIPRSRWRLFAAALGAAVLPLAMWSPVLLNAPSHSMGWVDMLTGPGRPGRETLQVLAPAGPFPALFEPLLVTVPPLLSIAAFMLISSGCLIGAARLCFRDGVSPSDCSDIAQPMLGLLPIVVLGTLALNGIPAYFAGRSESMVWPLAAAFIAALVSPLPRRWRVLAVGPFVTLGLFTVMTWLIELPDWPPPLGVLVGRELMPELGADDMIVVTGLWQLEVEHGLAEAQLATKGVAPGLKRVRTLPRSQADHPGWFDREAAVSPTLAIEAKVLELEGWRNAHRIWLVWSPGLPLERTIFPVFAGWQRIRMGASPIIAVDLLLPPSRKERDK